MDSLEHLITRSIKTYYKNRLYAPIIFLAILLVLTLLFPVGHMLFPKTYSEDNVSLYQLYNKKETYAKFQLTNLYFTGYTSKWLDRTRGYYYYTMVNSECVIVLLDPNTCEQGTPTIEELTVRGQILYESNAARSLLSNLARDLNWSEEGIMSTVSSYTISEPDATGIVAQLFGFIYIFAGIYSILSIIVYCVFIAFPVLSVPFTSS